MYGESLPSASWASLPLMGIVNLAAKESIDALHATSLPLMGIVNGYAGRSIYHAGISLPLMGIVNLVRLGLPERE